MSSTDSQTAAPGRPIPSPADFPVSWEDPADAKLTWMRDTHLSEPVAPLGFSVAAAFIEGFNPAQEQLGGAISFRVRSFNGYIYGTVVPTDAPPEVWGLMALRCTSSCPGCTSATWRITKSGPSGCICRR